MGYIMPITQFEYLHYTNRTIAEEKSSFSPVSSFQTIHPVKFNPKREEHSFPKESVQLDHQPDEAPVTWQTDDYYKNDVPEEVIERTFMEVTGLGKFINESI